MKLLPLLSIAASIAIASCSSKTDDSVTYDVSAQYADSSDTDKSPARSTPRTTPKKSSALITSESADPSSEPYRLGQDQALKIHQCRSTTEQQDMLLDINARLTNIRGRIGEEAANDFLHGFRDRLTELGDTLAVSLFGE